MAQRQRIDVASIGTKQAAARKSSGAGDRKGLKLGLAIGLVAIAGALFVFNFAGGSRRRADDSAVLTMSADPNATTTTTTVTQAMPTDAPPQVDDAPPTEPYAPKGGSTHLRLGPPPGQEDETEDEPDKPEGGGR